MAEADLTIEQLELIKQLRDKLWTVEPPSNVKYGCFCDLFAMEPGSKPDTCVMDKGFHSECTYAEPGMIKESCSEWKPWTEESLAKYWESMKD